MCIALYGCKAQDERVWARKLFGILIVAIRTLRLLMSPDFQAWPIDSVPALR